MNVLGKIGRDTQDAMLRRPEVARALVADLVSRGARRVILVGTPASMQDPHLKAPIAHSKIMVLTPPANDKVWLAELQNDLAHGTVPSDARMRFKDLVAEGAEHGVDCLVVASAELMELARMCDLDLPVVDALRAGSSAVKNVVFDMGGVLLKWDPVGMARAVCDSSEDAERLSKAVFGSQEWVLQDADAVDAQTVAWTSKQRVPARLHDAVDKLVFHWHDDRVFMPHTAELIHALKAQGYGIYLLSNAGVAFGEYKSQLPAYECFDGMVVSCYEHVIKPDARIYQTLLNRYGLDPATCVFVDDVERNAEGARRVGMQGWRFDGSVEALRYFLLGSTA